MELDRINAYLSDDSQTELVVRDDKIREEYINILAFLGKINPRSTVDEYFPLGTYRGIYNSASIHLALERPMFCETPPSPATLAPLGDRLTVLYIQPRGKASDSHRHPDASIVFSTPSLVLRTNSNISER